MLCFEIPSKYFSMMTFGDYILEVLIIEFGLLNDEDNGFIYMVYECLKFIHLLTAA